MDNIQKLFLVGISIVCALSAIGNIMRGFSKDKKPTIQIIKEYTKLLRVCILADNDDTVSIKLVDLEKSKCTFINLPKSHMILKQLDTHGLVTVKCQLINYEEVYPDIPEIYNDPTKSRYFCR